MREFIKKYWKFSWKVSIAIWVVLGVIANFVLSYNATIRYYTEDGNWFTAIKNSFKHMFGLEKIVIEEEEEA